MRTVRESLFSLSLAAFAVIGLPVTFLQLASRAHGPSSPPRSSVGLVVAWVALREPLLQPQPVDIDEEFVRRLEALVARMREELDERRATPAR